MLFGLYFFSFTIGSLSSILSGIDTKENALINKLAVIDEFAKEANLSKNLQNRLRHALRYSIEQSGFS
jgi:hyperpolarization activated cyclic nucleotide-gated potassium channel 1